MTILICLGDYLVLFASWRSVAARSQIVHLKDKQRKKESIACYSDNIGRQNIVKLSYADVIMGANLVPEEALVFGH
jgi:hypothetical protein